MVVKMDKKRSKKRKIEHDRSDSGSDFTDDESLDSDEELQKAFAAGKLQSGTFKEIIRQDRIINDVEGLQSKLEDLKSDLPWIERLDLTVDPAMAIPGATEIEEEDKIHDDFKRELHFYRLGQSAVLQGLPKLHKLGVLTKRPEDYFAQMAKSDDHMKKIREKLLSASMAAERSEKAKKMRELKKMGKKVQVEVLKSRQKDKKEMLEAVKKYRKGQQDKLDFLNDGTDGKKGKNVKGSQGKSKDGIRRDKKRDYKNAKFGFGGQKKRSKGNTKESYADGRDYNKKKNGMTPTKNKKMKSKAKKTERPGKSKRMAARSKR